MRKVPGIFKFMVAAVAVLGVFAVMAAPQLAVAASEDPLSITLTLKRVQTDAQGKETLVDAPSVKPGDLVEYQAVYANRGKQPLGNVVATLPLPQGMEYVGKSARPAAALASTDGKTFAAEPLKRTVKGKDGKTVVESVPYSEYRALRWQIKSLKPGEEYIVKARARVSQTPPQPPAVPETGAAKPGGGGS